MSQRLRHWYRAHLGPVCLAISLPIGALFGAGISLAVGRVTSPPPTVRIPIGIAFTSTTTVPTISVQIVGGPRLRLMLDSGSAGVEIFQSALRSTAGFTPTGFDLSGFSFGDGTTYYGQAYYVRMRFGAGGPVSRPVPVEVASAVVCGTGQTCADRDLEEGRGAYGIDGVLGIDPDPRNGALPNPLSYLPFPYSRQWQIAVGATGTGGSLTLGAALPDTATWEVPMAPAPDPVWGKGWDPTFRACWHLGSSRPRCLPTILDTGTTDVYPEYHPKGVVLLGDEDGFGVAAPDQSWQVDLGGYSLVTGDTNEEEMGGYFLVLLSKTSSPSIIGIHALGGLVVTFDLTQGLEAIQRVGPTE